jgi:N-acetylmuramoyl-L-alanine amidase
MILARTARHTALALVLALACAFTLFASPVPGAQGTTPPVVVIDAGHQKKADLRPEPIGPGSSKTKPRVAGGTSGVVTHKRESKVNLEVALKLKTELEKRGVKVVMVRTTEKVNISNSARAKIANKAHADLFIRLHCDGSPRSSTHGLLVLVPGKNKWTGPIVSRSAKAGAAVKKATLKTTKAKDRGISKRTDMAGFNWSKVPVIIVEMGLMTNPAEDRRLASSAYQRKLAIGMADGIAAYLASR